MKRRPLFIIIALMPIFVTASRPIYQVSAIGACRPVLGRWEWTQGIQDDDNAVMLVGHRTTTVRAYLTLPEGAPATCQKIEDVSSYFQLLGLGMGQGDLYEVRPDKGATVDVVAAQSWDRGTEASSLNFTFVPQTRFSTHAITVRGCFFPGYIMRSQCEEWFSDTKPVIMSGNPWIMGVPMSFNGSEPITDDIRAGSADLGVRAAFPLHEGSSYYLRQKTIALRAYDQENGGPKVPSRSDMFAELRAISTGNPKRDFYYGWFPTTSAVRVCTLFNEEQPTRRCARVASLSGETIRTEKIGFGMSGGNYYRMTLAHEFGHSINMNHTAFNATNEFGWDAPFESGRMNGVSRAKPLGQFQEVMYFPNPNGPLPRPDKSVWPRTGEYLTGMYNALNEWWMKPRSPRAIQMVPVHAPEDLTGTWSIGNIMNVVRTSLPIEPAVGNDAELVVRDSSGASLYSTTFNPFTEEDEAQQYVSSLITLPYDVNAQSAELYVNGQLQDVASRSVNAPTVSIIAPSPGESLSPTSEISWTVADQDGDPILSSVYYSHDGHSLTPLVYMTDTNHVTLGDIAALPYSPAGQLVVVVSDGFNTVEASVSGLQLGANHAPRTEIVSPLPMSEFAPGQNVVLLGMADDLEDGELPQSSITWISSLQGILGNGLSINADSLVSGHHLITLSATDSGGMTGSSIIAVDVQ